MAGLFNTPEGCEFLGINTDKEYGLIKAKKGTPQYEQWLEKYRAKRGAKPKEEQKADAKKALESKRKIKDNLWEAIIENSDGGAEQSKSYFNVNGDKYKVSIQNDDYYAVRVTDPEGKVVAEYSSDVDGSHSTWKDDLAKHLMKKYGEDLKIK